MLLSGVFSHYRARHNVILDRTTPVEPNEDVKEILGRVTLGRLSQEPVTFAALISVYLDADTPSGIDIRSESVDTSGIAKGERGHVSAARQLCGNKILTGYTREGSAER